MRGRNDLAAAAIALLAGCAHVNPYYDPGKAHHRPDGFRNLDPQAIAPRPFGDFLRWRRERAALEIPAPKRDLSVVAPRMELVRAEANHFAVTWIGHATALVQIGHTRLLTDPIFSERPSPLQWIGPRRWQPPGVALAQLPRIDVVLISHNHYDHLDEASVRALNAQPGGPPLFVVPLGIERWLQDVGVTHARALDWWDHVDVAGVRVHLTPVQHWSRRTFADANETLWGGFVVEGTSHGERRSVFFAGDTGYSERHFRDIGERFGPIDLALIPIGAYAPRWFMRAQHVNPEEAAQVHLDVRAKLSLGVHWGTFPMTDEPLDEPVSLLAAAREKLGLRADEFIVLRHGESLRLD